MNKGELVRNARFTVLLGKNGSGKSTLLRELDKDNAFTTRYISPERGGSLKYDPGVENNMFRNENWLRDDRRKNRTENFRQQSAAQFRHLEVLVLREIEKEEEKRKDSTYSFDTTINSINALLPQISIVRSDKGFSIQSKDGSVVNEDSISSGESELIALAIEVLVFSRQSSKEKILLLDEPDVHLHPDLQTKLTEFIQKVAEENDFRVVVATHSTAVTGAFSCTADLQIAPISNRGQTEFNSFGNNAICNAILPLFGAHPLSSHFTRSPVMLVEGEDDLRVIDQMVRSSNGRYHFSPRAVGSVDVMGEWEEWLNAYLPALYDDPIAYSLRDLDESPTCEIANLGVVSRIRLNCYSIENFLLSNETLEAYGQTPDGFCSALRGWVRHQPEHQMADQISALCDSWTDRRTRRIKDIRNIIVALLGTNKPWEVVVGQILARTDVSDDGKEGSVRHYLGEPAVRTLFT